MNHLQTLARISLGAAFFFVTAAYFEVGHVLLFVLCILIAIGFVYLYTWASKTYKNELAAQRFNATYGTIECAAIRLHGRVYALPRPARHSDIFTSREFPWWAKDVAEQGFVTTTGLFLDRHKACDVARIRGIIPKVKMTEPQNELFTEDLW